MSTISLPSIPWIIIIIINQHLKPCIQVKNIIGLLRVKQVLLTLVFVVEFHKGT